MLTENTNWRQLKEWAAWSGRHAQAELLLTGALLPVLESLFVNLLTGAEPGKGWPYGAALGILIIAHVCFLIVALFRERTTPASASICAVEAEDKLATHTANSDQEIGQLQRELGRRSDTHRLIRSLFNDYNLQTCQINPAGRDSLCRGLSPIILRVAACIRTTLGVTSNEFSLELYCKEGAVEQDYSCSPVDGVRQALFYSPIYLDPCTPMRLGQRAPHRWALPRGLPGECCITSDKGLFYQDGKPADSLYFTRFATVPVLEVCTPNQIGVLVLTSTQSEPFADDVLDTMQFLATLIAQYISSHNRCAWEWQASQKREADRKRRAAQVAKRAAEDIDTTSESSPSSPTSAY